MPWHQGAAANRDFCPPEPVTCRKEGSLTDPSPRPIHVIDRVPQVLKAAVLDGQRQENAPELRFIGVEGAEAVVEAPPPRPGPTPLAERAKARIADVSGFQVRFRGEVLMDEDVRLQRVGAIGNPSTDLSRICVEHQVAAYWGVEATVSAERPKYAIIGIWGGLPRRGVAAPWHGG